MVGGGGISGSEIRNMMLEVVTKYFSKIRVLLATPLLSEFESLARKLAIAVAVISSGVIAFTSMILIVLLRNRGQI